MAELLNEVSAMNEMYGEESPNFPIFSKIIQELEDNILSNTDNIQPLNFNIIIQPNMFIQEDNYVSFSININFKNVHEYPDHLHPDISLSKDSIQGNFTIDEAESLFNKHWPNIIEEMSLESSPILITIIDQLSDGLNEYNEKPIDSLFDLLNESSNEKTTESSINHESTSAEDPVNDEYRGLNMRTDLPKIGASTDEYNTLLLDIENDLLEHGYIRRHDDSSKTGKEIFEEKVIEGMDLGDLDDIE